MATHSNILAWRIPMDRGACWATAHGVTESDMTEQPSKAQHKKTLRRGNILVSNNSDFSKSNKLP